MLGADRDRGSRGWRPASGPDIAGAPARRIGQPPGPPPVRQSPPRRIRPQDVNLEELVAFLGRNPMLSLALAGITTALLYTEFGRLLRGYKALRPAELTGLINRENALVVDLRSIADFDKGHIPGSKNVQMSQFDPEAKQLAPAKALPVVLVCKSGMTAGGAAQRLKKAGFEKVYVLDGGIGGWQQADLPLAKGRA